MQLVKNGNERDIQDYYVWQVVRRCKTVIFDGIISAFIGSLFGMTLKGDSQPGSRKKVFIFAALTEALFFAAAEICYSLNPDWMWMYTVRASEISHSLIALVALAIYPLSFILFFKLISCIASKGARMGIVIALASVQLFLLVALFERYFTVGTYDEYAAGKGESLPKTQLGIFLAAAGLALIPFSVYLLFRCRRIANERA